MAAKKEVFPIIRFLKEIDNSSGISLIYQEFNGTYTHTLELYSKDDKKQCIFSLQYSSEKQLPFDYSKTYKSISAVEFCAVLKKYHMGSEVLFSKTNFSYCIHTNPSKKFTLIDKSKKTYTIK